MTPSPILQFDRQQLCVLDQTRLPYERCALSLRSLDAVADAIRRMQVRGAPLIGATAACGVAIALSIDASDEALGHALKVLGATRPTAVNLHWALARMARVLRLLPPASRAEAAEAEARAIMAEDVAVNARIGEHGLALLHELAAGRDGPVRVMTHCNAGWLATLGHGTALAPIYAAHAEGLAVEVWVSETRPRNQGLLTAWELQEAGVPHRLIADNAAGLLMMRGEVDMVITGADRVAANGDSANKVGTYLKALAAHDNGVPFYIAAPMSTIDFDCPDGAAIPIEERDANEVREVRGFDAAGQPAQVAIAALGTAVGNPAFDVTPARLITGILTEHGVSAPNSLRQAAA